MSNSLFAFCEDSFCGLGESIAIVIGDIQQGKIVSYVYSPGLESSILSPVLESWVFSPRLESYAEQGMLIEDDWFPGTVSSLATWLDPTYPLTRWEDILATIVANIGDTMALIQDRSGHGAHFIQATPANKPNLVAWDANNIGIFISSSSKTLAGNTIAKNLTNGVPGITTCGVYEVPTTFSAARTLVRITLSNSLSKFNLYIENNGKVYLQTRRVVGDNIFISPDPTTALTPGGRYIIIASIDFTTGNYVIEINGSIIGQGSSGIASWTPGATCEALDPTASQWIGGSSAFTLGTAGERFDYNKAITAEDRSFARTYLNHKWVVY